MQSYLPIGILLVVGFIFVIGTLLLAAFLRPKHYQSIAKLSAYECGEEAVGSAWSQYQVRYYLIALAFVIFEAETMFLFPWAVAYRQLGMFAFVEMLIFLAILFIGWVYAFRKNALEWR